MTYKYYMAGLPTVPTSASVAWINDFQANLNYQFDNSSDLFNILEESSLASGSYINITVRINQGINSYTGEKLGDDFKLILFKEMDHAVDLGKYFYFDNNYWITYNTESIKNLVASAMVRRCNNVLRWTDTNGVARSSYCSIEYKTNNPRDNISKNDIETPGGYMKVYTQLNSSTVNISENQRFLFGRPENWVAFKTFGGGVKNFLNQKTLDNTSAQLLILEMQTTQVNLDTDDVVNGVADYYKYVQSGSSTAVANIVVSPNDGNILEGSSQIFDAHFYSGSTMISGSLIFSISGSNVPTNHYAFTALTPNTFSIINNERFMDYPLSILCSGSSGSRIFDVTLSGAW